jgi:UrcA family protein
MIRLAMAAIAIAAILGWLGPALDAVDDHSDEVNQAKNLEDAQRAAQAQQRFEKVARYMCGPQSPWREVSYDVIQCMNRAGKPTTKVSITKE